MKNLYLVFLFLFLLTACTIQESPVPIEEQAAQAVDNLKLPLPKIPLPEHKVTSPNKPLLLTFNQLDYQESFTNGNKILLYFTSKDCSICSEEQKELKKALTETEGTPLVFLIDYEENTELAHSFNIKKTPAKVLLNNQEITLKTYDFWNKEKYQEYLKE